MHGWWAWLPWIGCATAIAYAILSGWRDDQAVQREVDDARADALEEGRMEGLAWHEADVRDHLARGFVLRGRADGSPVWVRDKLTAEQVAAGPPGMSGQPDGRRAAGSAERRAPSASRGHDADEHVDPGGAQPDWRDQVTSDLSALDVPRAEATSGVRNLPESPLSPGHTGPIVRTPWLRDRTAQAVAEWERFESELATWAARVEEVIEG